MKTIPSNALELLPERWAVKVDKGHERWKEFKEWYCNVYGENCTFGLTAYGRNCVIHDTVPHKINNREIIDGLSLCHMWTLDEFYQYLAGKIEPKPKEARQYTSEFLEELCKDIKPEPIVTVTKEYESAYVFVESENASARIEISINWEKKTFELSTPGDESVSFDKLDIEYAELLIVAQQKAIEYIKERFKEE